MIIPYNSQWVPFLIFILRLFIQFFMVKFCLDSSTFSKLCLLYFLVEKECLSIFHDLLVTERTTVFTWFWNITYVLTYANWNVKITIHRQGSKIARNQLLPHTHTHVITAWKFVLFSWQQQKTGSLFPPLFRF